MNRRGFIRALVAVPLALALPIENATASIFETDEDKFKRLIATGLVANEHFAFRRTVNVFVPDGTIIAGCSFHHVTGRGDMVVFNNTPHGLHMKDCYLSGLDDDQSYYFRIPYTSK